MRRGSRPYLAAVRRSQLKAHKQHTLTRDPRPAKRGPVWAQRSGEAFYSLEPAACSKLLSQSRGFMGTGRSDSSFNNAIRELQQESHSPCSSCASPFTLQSTLAVRRQKRSNWPGGSSSATAACLPVRTLRSEDALSQVSRSSSNTCKTGRQLQHARAARLLDTQCCIQLL